MKKILTLLFLLVGLMSAGDAWAQSQTVTVKKCFYDTKTSGSASDYTLYYSNNTYANEWAALADLKAGTNFTAYSSPSFEYSGVNIVSQASLSSTWIGISYKFGSNTWYCVVKNCGSNLYNYYTSDAVTGWIWKDCPVTYDPSKKTMSIATTDNNYYDFAPGVETTTEETINYGGSEYNSFYSLYKTIQNDVYYYVGMEEVYLDYNYPSISISTILNYFEELYNFPSTSSRITVAVIGSDGEATLKGQPSQFVIFNNLTLALDEAATTAPSFTEGTSYDVTVTRTLKAEKWNTLCLPFSMTADEITTAKLGTVMKMTGIENNVVSFETATTIESGEMYIVKPTEAVTSFTASSKTLSTPEVKEFGDDWTVDAPMYQTAISQEAGNTKYVLSNDKFFTVNQQDLAVKGFRWVITNTTGAGAKTGLGISFDGDVATAISNIDADVDANNNGKFLQNGQLVIKKDGKTYNAAGQQIR